jgi:hypothetical protein
MVTGSTVFDNKVVKDIIKDPRYTVDIMFWDFISLYKEYRSKTQK